MKKQVLLVALGLFTVTAFSQKNELKAAEKAIKKQDFTGAVTAINSAEGLIANADAKLKSKFYFLKGQAFGGKKDFATAAKAYSDLFAFEKSIGKERYSDNAIPLLNALKDEVNKRAFALHDAKNYKEAGKAFYLRYTLDKKDTLYLANAAQLALQAEDLDNAYNYYNQLKDLGYTGVKKEYGAIDKESNKKILFNSKEEMNLMMKSGRYINNSITNTPSKRNDVLKNLVSILSKQKKFKEAIGLIQQLRKQEPGNLQLLLTEAFIYNDLNQPEKFAALMKEATEKDPTNPDLYFNIGIVNYNAKNIEEAEEYFTKAVAIKADYPKGNWMLANTLLLKDGDLVTKMNALPMSDVKNYEKYQAKRKKLFNKVLPILLKADKAERTATSVRMLIGVYEQLEMSDKASELRKVLDTLE
ncbi:TPR repeat-containing protein YrrB [Polaribacter huanghezhanensis]|uniref:tetratricopeptide repeat protein n=1 Tax=Polaribacter huanghezhanensis TaxID=1354726 RepID=UPI0026495252|nr:tetratricopeptide repeat protein [Polaribacter huanghezhanensis]WKD86280.1 TPR repeat-containing protein YrrB [Polaribacter huanghezhanensis]